MADNGGTAWDFRLHATARRIGKARATLVHRRLVLALAAVWPTAYDPSLD